MPRYFFHVYDHVTLTDEVGTELKDIAAAQIHASTYAGKLILSAPENVWRGGRWSMEVTDAHGFLYFRLDLIASQTRTLAS